MSEIINENNNNFSLEKFNPLIQEVESKTSMYMSLSISWLDDKENIDVVQKAKMEVVRLRTSIEKDAKAIRDPHTQFNNLVSQKEKEMLARLLPVEEHLKAEQEKVKQLKLQKEKEEQEKQKKIFQERINKLSNIWHTPGNFFAIWNMKDDEFEKYYNEIKEENEIKEKIQIGLNMISSCLSLEELEELHHNDSFLETYQTQQFKEAFEKRFNEITEDIKKKQELFTLQLVNKINSANSLKELEELDFPNEDVFCIPYNNKKEFLIKQEHNNKILEYTNIINSLKSINELEDFYNSLEFYKEELEILYKQQKQFLKQQEELNKIKAEQEEKRKQEEEEQKKKQQEEEQKRKLKETRIADLKSKIWNTQIEEELKELYFKEDIQDLIPEVKHIFTERKNEILEKVKKDQQQKEFQQYLYSIWYSPNDCIIQKNSQWETLIYKLIGKWNK